jgi:hypothetical protein
MRFKFIFLLSILLFGTACNIFNSAMPYEETLFVGSTLAECVGVGPQTCMLVRNSPDQEWTYFYDGIKGFEYETGFEYELRVKVTPIANPDADASSLEYELIEIVSKTPAK